MHKVACCNTEWNVATEAENQNAYCEVWHFILLSTVAEQIKGASQSIKCEAYDMGSVLS